MKADQRRAVELLYSATRSAGIPVGNVVETDGVLAGFDCRVVVEFGDGSGSSYELRIFEKNDADPRLPSVRESVLGQKLPSTCPMRHINEDGSFCLGWREETWLRPQTEDEALQWWNKLRGYLLLQEYAQRFRRWPEQFGWPHGDAAKYQAEFEEVAKGLPDGIVQAVKRKEFTLTDGRKKVTNRRRPCPCGSGRRIKDCHEKGIVGLVELAALRDEADADFAIKLKGRACCGTMDDCPLQAKQGRFD